MLWTQISILLPTYIKGKKQKSLKFRVSILLRLTTTLRGIALLWLFSDTARIARSSQTLSLEIEAMHEELSFPATIGKIIANSLALLAFTTKLRSLLAVEH